MRASAVAERLWSPVYVNDPAAAQPRLADHRCRLAARGIATEPVQPSWCDGSRV
jgi:hexosaminidase